MIYFFFLFRFSVKYTKIADILDTKNCPNAQIIEENLGRTHYPDGTDGS